MTLDWTTNLARLPLRPADGESFAPLGPCVIDAITQHIGKPLPADYLSFITTYGACDFDALVFYPGGGGKLYVGEFVADAIVTLARQYEERLPQGMIPINEDGMGNLFCLSVREQKHGAIYFHHHCVGWDDHRQNVDQAKLETLHLVAPNFAKFIEGLAVEE